MTQEIVSLIAMRHTKIVATFGPACDNDAVLDDLIAAGVDVFRLNFSHGTHATHAAAFRRIRAAAARASRHVGILQDLCGPKIRTGTLAGGQPIELQPGDALRIVTGTEAGFLRPRPTVFTSYAGLAESVRPGDRLLLDDGRIELRVEKAGGGEISAVVVHGGALAEHKGINAPGVALPASAFTPKDEADLAFGVSLGVDSVALSFVQSAEDVCRARRAADAAGAPALPLVAKIERPQAVDRLDEILQACNGIMIARGDLGLELPLEQVPRVQKELTDRARALGRPVIVATQVLDSMRTEPRPTRAEVSDAAHAVADGVDGIMLAGETAVGRAPARVVRTLDAIIADAESGLTGAGLLAGASGRPGGPLRTGQPAGPGTPAGRGFAGLEGLDRSPALCEAAVTLAERGHAEAIVAITRTGRTARLLSAFRPGPPVYAVTPDAATARRLAGVWGVVPVVGDIGDGFVPAVPLAEHLVAPGVLAGGAKVVIVSVDPDLSRADTNFLKLQRL
jgi:pyruvate kinase